MTDDGLRDDTASPSDLEIDELEPAAAAAAPAAPGDPDSEGRASYGQKFLRRLPIVTLIVTIPAFLVLLSTVAGDPLGMIGRSAGANTDYREGTVLGSALGPLLGGLFWTAIAALFPGRRRAPRRGQTALVVGALTASVVVGGLLGLQITRAPDVTVAPIASPAEGCQAYLDMADDLARRNLSAAAAAPYFAALSEAAAVGDPALSADLEPLTTTPTQQELSDATASIITRCVTEGHTTAEAVTAWLDKIQSYAG